jgi:hypothetical protein
MALPDDARSAWLLWTSTERSSTAVVSLPDRVSRVVSVGPRSSLPATGRIDTPRLMPPKLNHVRCQPARDCAHGERQSARTTSVCWPAARSVRISNGR